MPTTAIASRWSVVPFGATPKSVFMIDCACGHGVSVYVDGDEPSARTAAERRAWSNFRAESRRTGCAMCRRR